MATSDTIYAIYKNIKSVVGSLGHKVRGQRVSLRSLGSTLGTTAITVEFKGSTFENSTGYKPKYDNSNFDIGVKFTDEALDTALARQVSILHAIKEALTVEALNIDELAVSKMVSRVTVNEPSIEYTPPETNMTVPVTVRYRES